MKTVYAQPTDHPIAAQLPPRAVRRNAARMLGQLTSWRRGRRFVDNKGTHYVVHPNTIEDMSDAG